MKKRVSIRRLGRTHSHRWSMFRNMVSSLIEHERIVTTVPKAKELTRLADKMITLAKNGGGPNQPNDYLHNRRRAAAIVRGEWNVTKLFDVLGPRYKFREGGYTRILKLSKPRAGDNAPMAVIEYVDRPGEIRAARPPNVLQEAAAKSHATGTPLEQILKEMGIPTIDELVDEDEKEEMEMELNK